MDQQTVNDDDFVLDESDVAPSDQTEKTDGSAVEATGKQSAENADAEAVDAGTSNDSADNTTETQTDGGSVDDTSAKLDKESLNGFLAKRHIDPNDPDALLKVAEMYRNADKKLNESFQAKAKLERQIASGGLRPATADQQALSEVRSLKAEMSAADWKRQKGLTPEDESKMLEYLQRPLLDENGNPAVMPETGQELTRAALVTQGILSLDEVYKIVGGGSAQATKVDSLKEDFKGEVKKEMAAKQGLKRPAASATNSTQFGKSEENDPFAEEFDKD